MKFFQYFKGKKGNVQDAAFIGLFLVVLGIVAYPLINSFITLNDVVQADTEIDAVMREENQKLTDNLPDIIDGIYLMLVIGGYLSAFILAFFIDTHPAFFIMAFLFITAILTVIPLLANVWDSVVTGNFTLAESQLTVIPFIMQNYLKITIVMWITLIGALYARRSFASQ